jgi:hypothetical protein
VCLRLKHKPGWCACSLLQVLHPALSSQVGGQLMRLQCASAYLLACIWHEHLLNDRHVTPYGSLLPIMGFMVDLPKHRLACCASMVWLEWGQQVLSLRLGVAMVACVAVLSEPCCAVHSSYPQLVTYWLWYGIVAMYSQASSLLMHIRYDTSILPHSVEQC